MVRKPRGKSVEATLIAFDAMRSSPLRPPHPLDAEESTVWAEIMARRARREWKSLDLHTAARLAHVMVQLHREEQRLNGEGLVVAGRTNPRFGIVKDLGQEALRLQRFLRLHPASDGRAPGLVRGGRQEEEEARDILAGDGAFLAKQ